MVLKITLTGQDITWHDMTWYDMIMIWHDMSWHDLIWYNIIECNVSRAYWHVLTRFCSFSLCSLLIRVTLSISLSDVPSAVSYLPLPYLPLPLPLLLYVSSLSAFASTLLYEPCTVLENILDLVSLIPSSTSQLPLLVTLKRNVSKYRISLLERISALTVLLTGFF